MPGTHKLLLPFPDRPIVRCSAEAALASGVGPLAVVVERAEGPVAEALRGLPLTLLENPGAAGGISTSLGRAADWAFGRADALLLLLADEPGMRPDVIRSLAELWRERRPPAARAVYRDRPGHPVLVTAAFLEAEPGPRGDRGLGARLASEEVAPLPVEGPAPVDIDTEAAYREALARLAH